MKRILLVLLITAFTARAQDSTATLTWKYNPIGTPEAIYASNGVTPLSGAGTSANGDGFVLQLGYYTGATNGSDLFTGTWIPLYGPGSVNSGLFPTAGMGDGTGTTGTDDRFVLTGTVDLTTNTTTDVPSQGQIMAIRYYNASSVGTATFFGAISDTSWIWETPLPEPSSPSMSFNFLDSGVAYQGGASEPETNISTVPEPSTISFLAGAVAIGAMVIRRRKQ